MEVCGKVYRKATANRWVCVANIEPILFDEITVEETDDQLVVAGKILECANKLGYYDQPSESEIFLAQDMIYVVVGFVDEAKFESKMILWGKTDKPLYRKGDVGFWSDVTRTTGIKLSDEG